MLAELCLAELSQPKPSRGDGTGLEAEKLFEVAENCEVVFLRLLPCDFPREKAGVKMNEKISPMVCKIITTLVLWCTNMPFSSIL